MGKILIVDDNADVLHVMEIIFTTRNFEVVTTTKGEETFSLADTFKPALIFLDINLGGMDGRDISRQLKGTDGTKHIPIILFSANMINNNTLKESLADEFVAKPFDVADLMVKVNKFIDNEDSEETRSI
jgi:DNA-binding response OmpR family regulator